MREGRRLARFITLRLFPALVLAAVTFVACSGDGQDGRNGNGGMGPQNQAPSVQITAPADGSIFDVGADVTFQAQANDPEDGALTGDDVAWESDVDGALGTGTSLTVNDLSPGEHTITVTATDSDGATAEASIGIIVEPPADARFTIRDDQFVDPQGRVNEEASVTIDAGGTVRWRYLATGQSQHTVTSGEGPGGQTGDGLPDGAMEIRSGLLSPGDAFEHTFQVPGTYTVYCEVHPTIMFNTTVIVQ